ncbi:hypothetical protein [Nonomuraea sp. NPDC050783]|uniref:hypothetical protein n=1 Tax=Nonomuraea sp. NPDC050783 TaxID=3154634 RepID=UPI0034654253
MLTLAAAGETVEGGAGGRVVVPGQGEVRGLGDDARLGVELELDLVADRDTRGPRRAVPGGCEARDRGYSA